MLADPQTALARAQAAGFRLVVSLLDPIDFPELPRFEAPGMTIKAMVGVHPHNAKDYTPEVERQLLAALKRSDVAGIGEIGLDYHYDLSPRPVQQAVFRRQLELAAQLDKPVQLHIREADEDALAILAAGPLPEAGVELHCCTLPYERLRPYLRYVRYVAFGGALTFNKSEEIRGCAAALPLEVLLTETDCPYMAPVPLRGAPSEPAQILFTAQALARVRGLDGADAESARLYERLYTNACDFFAV
jgi:TatD DNase family protein